MLKAKLKNRSKSTEQDSGFLRSFGLGMFFSKKAEEVESPVMLQEESELKDKMGMFDNMLAKECIYCGPGIVDSILAPFEDEA